MSPQEIVALLDRIDATDPEQAHVEADRALLACQPKEVQDAHQRLMDRTRWWAFA